VRITFPVTNNVHGMRYVWLQSILWSRTPIIALGLQKKLTKLGYDALAEWLGRGGAGPSRGRRPDSS